MSIHFDCEVGNQVGILVYSNVFINPLLLCAVHTWVNIRPPNSFLSPPEHIARWAHMHRFLSVCLSVRLSVCHTFKNSYLRKYYRQESETLPQYKTFIGVSRKNTDHTLKIYFQSASKLDRKSYWTKNHISKSIIAWKLNLKPKYKKFISQYVKTINYTLRKNWQVNMSFFGKSPASLGVYWK